MVPSRRKQSASIPSMHDNVPIISGEELASSLPRILTAVTKDDRGRGGYVAKVA